MSRIQELPTEIRDLLHRLLRSGVSQRAILKCLESPLREAGEEPLSASGLNRYATRMQIVGQRIRESREIASAWTAHFGQEPASEVNAHIIEMLRTLTFDMTLKAVSGSDDDSEGIEEMSAGAINDLAQAVRRLEQASEIGARRERELRRELGAKAEREAKRAGISADTAAAIRAALTAV